MPSDIYSKTELLSSDRSSTLPMLRSCISVLTAAETASRQNRNSLDLTLDLGDQNEQRKRCCYLDACEYAYSINPASHEHIYLGNWNCTVRWYTVCQRISHNLAYMWILNGPIKNPHPRRVRVCCANRTGSWALVLY